MKNLNTVNGFQELQNGESARSGTAHCCLLIFSTSDSKPGYLGHFATLMVGNKCNPKIVEMLQLSVFKLNEVFVKVRGHHSDRTYDKNDRLIVAQERRCIENVLRSMGLLSRADIEWGKDNMSTEIIYDGQRNQSLTITEEIA